MRADAQRNLASILEAARAEFAEGGLEVCVADIARRAGVGTATIFRRFPTKEQLVVAVAEEKVLEMLALIVEAEAAPDAWTGLQGLIWESMERQIRDRGLIEALSGRLVSEPRLRELHGAFMDRAGALLTRAQADGEVRDDLSAFDLPLLFGAIARAGVELEAVAPGAWRRSLAVVIDGMRAGAPTPLEPGPVTREQLDAAFAALPCSALRKS